MNLLKNSELLHKPPTLAIASYTSLFTAMIVSTTRARYYIIRIVCPVTSHIADAPRYAIPTAAAYIVVEYGGVDVVRFAGGGVARGRGLFAQELCNTAVGGQDFGDRLRLDKLKET